MISDKSAPAGLLAIAAVVVSGLLAAPQQAAAQAAPSPYVEAVPATGPARHARSRITINPAPLLYRRCVDWYELQDRPSGTVLFPQMRCWWVRG